MLHPKHANEINQFSCLLEASEYVFFLLLLVIVFDEVAHDPSRTCKRFSALALAAYIRHSAGNCLLSPGGMITESPNESPKRSTTVPSSPINSISYSEISVSSVE